MRLPRLMWGHEHWQAQLSIYLDGRLEERERAALERHLTACAACREELAGLRTTVALVRAVPAVTLPRSFVLRPADVEAFDPSPSGMGGTWGQVLFGGMFREGMRWATVAAALLLIGVTTYDVGTTVMAPESLASRSVATTFQAPEGSLELQQKSAAMEAAPAGAPAAPASPSLGPVPGGGATQDALEPPSGLGSGGDGSGGAAGSAADTMPPPLPAEEPILPFNADDSSTAASGAELGPAQVSPPLAPAVALRIAELALAFFVLVGGAVLWWSRPQGP